MTHNMIPLSQARHPSGLQLPLTLRWKRCRDMPCAMYGLQSVTVRQKVFVGGGLTHGNLDDAHVVYEYDEASNKWISLPLYDYRWFGMSVLTDKLVLVGGMYISTGEITNQVAVWEEMSQGWTHPYPPMTTPRLSPAVATYRDMYGYCIASCLSRYLAHAWVQAGLSN